MKLDIPNDVKLYLKEMKEVLAGTPDGSYAFNAEGGCGEQCKITCAHYCKSACETLCQAGCSVGCSSGCFQSRAAGAPFCPMYIIFHL